LKKSIKGMKSGEIVENGDVKQIFANPKDDYTKKLIKSAFI